MSRKIHECRSDNKLGHVFQKLPTWAVCEHDDCYWQRYAVDASPANQHQVRALADHHARTRQHPVTVHLLLEVHLVPEGEPQPSGAFPVPQPRSRKEEA